MKKLVVLSAVFMVATAGKTFAKEVNMHTIISPDTTKPSGGGHEGTKGWIELPSTSFNEGLNTIRLPGGKGTLTFTKTGQAYYHGFKYLTINGMPNVLEPATAGSRDIPASPCKNNLPNAFFTSADKKICVSICNDSGKHLIMMLLPAVQKVREAAN